MKAKHILTAIALPALLAACSQDMELSDAMNQKDFSNIPTVDVEFGAAIDANTKMATKFGWEVKDKIGLAWLGDGTVISENGKAYQNIPMFCTNASTAAFKSETLLYIGKYFAYMPYTEGSMTVENIAFTTAGQKLTTNANDLAKNAIYISPKKVELTNEQPVPSGKYGAGMGKNIPLNLSRLSNAATLDLTFKNVENLTDLKVMGISIDVTKTESAVTTHLLPTSFKYNPQENPSTTEWSSLAIADVVKFFSKDTGGSLSADADKGAISVTSNAGLSLNNGKLKTYALILPAIETMNGVGATYELAITISTQYGDIKAEKVKVEGGDWKTSGLFTLLGQTGTITATVDAGEMTFPDKTVKTQAELNSVLAAAAAAGAEDEIEITINPTEPIADSKPFELKDFAMPEGLKAPITLVAGLNANNGLDFTGTSTIDKVLKIESGTSVSISGTLNVKNVKENDVQVTALEATKIVINAGGVLNNEGQIKSEMETKGATPAPNAKVAGLYVSASDDARFEGVTTFTNGGEVKWVAGNIKGTDTEAVNISGSGAVFVEAVNFKNMKDAAAANVTTARFKGELTFGNEGTSFEVGMIKNIEVYGKITININANAITVAQTVNLSALKNLTIKEGGSLSIISNNKTNILQSATDSKTVLEKNSALTIKKLTLNNFKDLEYAGKVTLEDVTTGFTATPNQQPGGTLSNINN